MTANRIADAQKQLDTLIRAAYAKAVSYTHLTLPTIGFV